MAELPLARRPDAVLEAALRGFADEIAWPGATPTIGGVDVATTVRARIVEGGGGARPVERSLRRGWGWRPARRALVVAVIVLLALAALAGAAGLGLPGLRILLGGPTPVPVGTPRPTASQTPTRTLAPGPPGSGLRLGTPVDPDGLDAHAGFHVGLPSDIAIGPPDAAWINRAKNGMVTLVWTADDRLPETREPGIGLLLSEFRGAVQEGYFSKILGQDTTIERVLVNGDRAFWLSGDPHLFFYEGPDGFVEDSRRWVGDALLWSDGPITYRLETALGRDAAIEIAESLR